MTGAETSRRRGARRLQFKRDSDDPGSGAAGSRPIHVTPVSADGGRPVITPVSLFGPLSVTVENRALTPRDFGGSKPKQLLEILALARGRSVSKDRLADDLWGDDPPASVSATLESYVSVLRRRLAPAKLVQTERYAYRFATERADLDLDRFDARLDQASTCGPYRAHGHLEAALALVQGELVEDEPYAPWAEPHRQAFRIRLQRARLDAANHALACRDLDAARSHAERALIADDLNEEAVRVLVAAAYASGRREEALRHFEACRQRLWEELGVQPMPDTAALDRQVREHRPVADVLPPPAWDGLPRALDLRSARVPFIDRVEEAEKLRAAIRAGLDGSYAHILVEGRSGTGKTRLIDQVVSQVDQARVGKARCTPAEQGLPFVPIAMALRAALPPDAPDPLTRILPHVLAEPGGAGRLRALEELAEVALGSGPTVLVIDDIHWADDSTITALSYLRHRCHAAPLVIVSATNHLRTRGTPPADAFHADHRIPLGPFGRAAVDALGHPGLFERTRGYPMFVAACLEVASEGREDELLLRLQPWVLEEAAHAGDDAALLLVTAAALARPFTPEELALAMDTALEPVSLQMETLYGLGLVAIHVDGFILESPLLAEVLISTMSPSRQRLVRERLQHHGLRDILGTRRQRQGTTIEHERAE